MRLFLALLAASTLALCLAAGSWAGSAPATGAAASSGRPGSARPPITKWLIPYGPKRKREMAAYSLRHYGRAQWRLEHPQVIVEHVAVAGTAAAVRDTFAPDHPDPELGELPNVCSHFVIGSSGRIFQLVNLRTRCRHTVGLNWTAIGIEHVGYSDGDVLGNPRELRASLRLTQYLRCRFGIKIHNVIGHAESLTSPFHHELVPSLRTQTHGDMRHSSMRVYRSKLRRLGPC
ncbi:MAG: peptidoglycan recognition family protein [Solirubrobacterales bacterium]